MILFTPSQEDFDESQNYWASWKNNIIKAAGELGQLGA